MNSHLINSLLETSPLQEQWTILCVDDEENILNKIWYENKLFYLQCLLIPFSFLFGLIIYLRRSYLKRFANIKNKVPVLVIGNLTVGGSGKTPLIIALVKFLKSQNKKVGVIARGYPVSPENPIILEKTSSAQEVGDEAILVFKETNVPVCVSKNRQAALQELLKHHDLDYVLSDDGLQNYHFHHDVEIIIYDKQLKFGNKKLLPAGPLREPLSKLNKVDFVLEKIFLNENENENENLKFLDESFALSDLIGVESKSTQKIYPFFITYQNFVCVLDQGKKNKKTVESDYFFNKKVVVVTAIAQTSAFFEYLKSKNIIFSFVTYHDHYLFSESDFIKFSDCEIIMTAKDAVKCQQFANEHFWYLELEANFSAAFLADFERLIVNHFYSMG